MYSNRIKKQVLHQIKSYLKFLLRATNAHGIHSPFVFALATKCLYDNADYPEYAVLEKFRNELLQDKNVINVTDFGAGSRIFKTNERRISDIARTAGINRKRAKLLFRVVRYFQPENILEIGTSVGLSTAALSIGNPNAKITTIEGCPETAGAAAKQFEEFGLSNIKQKVGKFNHELSSLPLSNFNFIYFDGNHQKDATLNYFEILLPTATDISVWILDDIHWSSGMEEAWDTIKKHPKVSVTIDTFQWGFVFFRTGQDKENFTVRI